MSRPKMRHEEDRVSVLAEWLDQQREKGACVRDTALGLLRAAERVAVDACQHPKEPLEDSQRVFLRVLQDWEAPKEDVPVCAQCGEALVEGYGKTIGCHGCDAELCSHECAQKHVQKEGHAA